MSKLGNTIALVFMPFMVINAQNISQPRVEMPYSFLTDVIDDELTTPTLATAYAECYLKKAKSEKNNSEMVNGYQYMLHFSDPKMRIYYADSLVLAALKTNDALVVGSAYLTRGIAYYDIKKHVPALENYVKANKYIASSNDLYLIHKVKFNIAQIKSYLGFYDESIALLQQCVKYYEPEGGMPYLSSLHSLAISYNKIGDFENCFITNKLGKQTAEAIDNTIMMTYFRHSDGVNFYSLGQYKESVEELLSTLPLLIKRGDLANQTVAHFYIGRSYWALGNFNKALTHFGNVDKALDQEYTRADLREMYELLIRKYKEENNAEQVLFYINRVYKADSLLAKNHGNLSRQIRTGLDSSEIEQYKAYANAVIRKKNIYVAVIFILCISLIGALATMRFRYQKKKRQFLDKCEELEHRQDEGTAKSQAVRSEDFNISTDTVEIIVKKLRKFESSKQYLDVNMNLTVMMQLFSINSKYIAMVIWRYHHRKANEYINDLKVNHIIELLKTHKKYREYSLKALSEEGGFGSTSRFTRAFVEVTSVKPLCYIAQLGDSTTDEEHSEPTK